MARLIFLVVVCGISNILAQQEKATNHRGNIDFLTKSQLRDYLTFIASDELEGRDTPSRGLDIAAKFIATNLSRWGYTPAGDNGGYFQKIRLLRSRIQSPLTVIEINGEQYRYGADFICTPVSTSLRDVPVVFVKNGYILRTGNIDPYKNVNIKGKIVVAVGGYPKGKTLKDFTGKLGIDYDTPSNYAKNNGAVALITIPTPHSLAQWEKNRVSYTDRGEMTVDRFPQDEKRSIVSITASQKLVTAIFAGEKIPAGSVWERASSESVEPFNLSLSKKINISVVTRIDTEYTQNIAGTLIGSDIVLRDEHIAFGAHYDHIGIGTSVNGDSIFNGADDDGSGTAALLSLAEAYSKGIRPKRSLLFVWHTGEEKGLLGSKYYTMFPTISLQSIVTQINMDMIGRSKPDTGSESVNDNLSDHDEVFVIGSKMMSTELGHWTEETNRSTEQLRLNFKYDDPVDPLKLFYRSDHYNYAKHGIPIVFYFDGLHEDYHGVDDEVEKIDFDKYLKVTKTVFALGWKLANLPKRPVVDKIFPKEIFN